MAAADSVLFVVTFASKDEAWIYRNQRESLRRSLFRSRASMLMINDTFLRRAANSCKLGYTGQEAIPSPPLMVMKYAAMR